MAALVVPTWPRHAAVTPRSNLPPPQAAARRPPATQRRAASRCPDKVQEPGAANRPVNNAILQMQIQQIQQQQQMINLLQNLGLQPQPAAAPPGPVERYPPRPPPPPLPAGRSVAQTSSNPWVAPDFPREPDVCRECELQQPHICPYSERGSESAGSLRRVVVAGLPADPRLPPGISHQPCPVNQWVVQNSESGAPRHEQLSPGAAAARPSQKYF